MTNPSPSTGTATGPTGVRAPMDEQELYQATVILLQLAERCGPDRWCFCRPAVASRRWQDHAASCLKANRFLLKHHGPPESPA